MNSRFEEARSAVQKARQALRNNQRTEARQWAEHAASLAPQMEDPWLILAAIATPRASMEYIQRALSINPNSPRAHKGKEWATQRLREGSAASPERSEKKSSAKQSRLLPILLLGAGVLLCGLVAWSASPVLASFIDKPAAPVAITSTHPPSWAKASIPKPTYTPQALAQTVIDVTPTFAPLDIPTDAPPDLPTEIPTEMDEVAPTASAWDGSISVDIVPDTPTAEAPAAAPTYAPQTDYTSAGGERWIDVNLSQQMVYAYEGNTVVNSFLVSTGTWETPTVTGQYHIYVKLRYTDMTGPGYYLPNVPYTMYFYQGYGLHGTYWHHNFGTPMSHGCVNLETNDAAWLYNWASVGTLVNVHY